MLPSRHLGPFTIHAHPEQHILCAGMAKLAPGAAEMVNASLPLGHAQATWDIAIAAVFLASNGARCISGDTLVRCPVDRSSSGVCSTRDVTVCALSDVVNRCHDSGCSLTRAHAC